MQAIKYIVLIAALAVAVALGMQTVVSGVVFESDKLVASDPTDGDHFGDSVDVFGDLAVVGVPRDDTIIGSDRVLRTSIAGTAAPRYGTKRII